MLTVQAFLRQLGATLSRGAPAHHAAFAALVASRYASVLGDELDPRPGAIVERLWTAAKGKALAAHEVEAFVFDLSAVGELVDPDRFDASDAYRALGVLEVAVRAAAGMPGSGPAELARAALAAKALLSPRDGDEIAAKLEERWAWEAVQEEAKWLGSAAGETLATVVTTAAATAPEAANVVELPVGARKLAFIEVQGKRYRAELDGTPRPIRTRISRGDVHEGQGGLSGATTSAWVEGEVADIAPLLACLARADAEKTQSSGKLTLSTSEQWGHFRQNRWTTVTVSIANDGAIEVDTAIATQDDSYY